MNKIKTHLKLLISIYSVILILFICFPEISFSQDKIIGQVSDSSKIIFKDTLNGFAVDSLTHDVGTVPNVNCRLIKYFKYLGHDKTIILRAWTGDPHYICEYPKERLVYGKIYSFKVCFAFKGKLGIMNKEMGFDLANGKRITFIFKGNIYKEE